VRRQEKDSAETGERQCGDRKQENRQCGDRRQEKDSLEKGPVGRPGPLRRKEKRKKVKMAKFLELGLNRKVGEKKASKNGQVPGTWLEGNQEIGQG
jgi:hypothetical protein